VAEGLDRPEARIVVDEDERQVGRVGRQDDRRRDESLGLYELRSPRLDDAADPPDDGRRDALGDRDRTTGGKRRVEEKA
jgi:hypothetical protein